MPTGIPQITFWECECNFAATIVVDIKFPETEPDDNEICCICLNPQFEHKCIKTPCGHKFHDKCIKRWLTTSTTTTCPSCRSNLN
jgi:SUMO ligase MMS21 Smc5/6 complex component